VQALVLVLNRSERLREVLDTFVRLGIPGATIVESFGMRRLLAQDAPIFAGLRKLMERDGPRYNHTIFAVVDDDTKVERAIEALKDLLGEEPNSGILFTIPINRMVKLNGDRG